MADVVLHQFSFNLGTKFGLPNRYTGIWKVLDMPLLKQGACGKMNLIYVFFCEDFPSIDLKGLTPVHDLAV